MDWSGSINLELGIQAVKLHKIEKNEVSTFDQHEFIRVEGKIENASLFIFFKKESKSHPKYLICNQTEETLIIRQKGNHLRGKETLLMPYQTSTFAWDDPHHEPKMIIVNIRNTDVRKKYSLESFWQNPPIVLGAVYKNNKLYRGERKIWAECHATGPTITLTFTDMNTNKLYGKETKSKSRDLELTASTRKGSRKRAGQDAVEKRKMGHTESIQMELRSTINSLGISLIDDTPQEIIFMQLTQISIDVMATDDNQYLVLSVGGAQIDNQLYNTTNPVMLVPKDHDTSSEEDSASYRGLRNFMQLSIVKDSKVTEVDYFKYFFFGLQELDLHVDSELLVRIMEFADLMYENLDLVKNVMEDEDDETENSMSMEEMKRTRKRTLVEIKNEEKEEEEWETTIIGLNSLELFKPTDVSVRSRMLYFDIFHIYPLAFELSFFSVSGVESGYVLSKILSFSGALTTIENAPIRLNTLAIQHAFQSREEFITRIAGHYKQQAINQIYSLLGSVDFVGAPISLVNNLGDGVYDFFYKPAQGLAVLSAQDFATGVAEGTSSLFRNTMTGFFNSTSKITGSFGKGAATLAFDADYLRERELAQRNRPKHVGEGLMYGVRDFGKGLWSGASGVIAQPMKGAESGGLSGFVKGVGRGVVGVAAKPVAGTFDLFSQTTKGLKNTATMLDRKDTYRQRPPRYFGSDNILTVYDYKSSEGQSLLWNLEDRRYCHQRYVTHVTTQKNILLFSNKFLFQIKPDTPEKLEWNCPIKCIKGMTTVEIEKGKIKVKLHLAPVSSGKFMEDLVGNKIEEKSFICFPHEINDVALAFDRIVKFVADMEKKKNRKDWQKTKGGGGNLVNRSLGVSMNSIKNMSFKSSN